MLARLLLVFSIFLLTAAEAISGTCWNGGSSGSSPWNVLDGDGGSPSSAYADVNYCINTTASQGDTVIVGAGSSSWSSTLVIDDAIILRGQTTCTPSGTPGSSGYTISCDTGTVITAAAGLNNYLIDIHPTTPADNPEIELSNLVIDGDTTTGQGGGIRLYNDNAVPVSNIKIHDIKVVDCSSHPGIYIKGFVYGLVYRNHFHNIGDGTNQTYLFRYDGDCYAWGASYPDYGTKNFLYFEDNYTTEIGYILDDSGTGARWVWRYNTMDISVDVPQKWFDLHEDVSNCGGIATEIYENSVSGTTTGTVKWAQVGMNHVIYNNVTGCQTNSCKIQLGFAGQASCTNYTDPAYQAHVDNSYSWNNVYSTTGYPVYVEEIDDPGCFSEDSEYWDDGDADYDGEASYSSNPIGYGNMFYDIASKRTGVCSDNDVYWETDNKVLYRCVGNNNWTEVYQPYQYPHALRNQTVYKAHSVNGIKMTVGGIGVRIVQ